MASINDKLTDVRNAARPNAARVSSPRSAGGATLSCDNLAGWPTASKVHFVTYQIDSSSNPIAGTQLDCYGIVSGNNIGSFTVVDGTDNGNSINDVVQMLPTAAWGQDLADWGSSQHSRTGAHVGLTNTGGMTTDTLTVSSGTTLPAGDIGTADLASGAVTFAKLLSTIFSGQVSTQANAGTAGGTMYYINLGGIKLLWASGLSVATGSSGGVTFPNSFFSTIQFYTSGMGTASGTAAVYVPSITLTGVASASIALTAGTGSGTEPLTLLVIGT